MAGGMQIFVTTWQEAQWFTRTIIAILFLGFLGSQVDAIWSVLALTPAYVTGRFYFWTLLTSSFMEANALRLVLDIILLLYTASIATPLWGSKEFVIFLSLVGTLATATALLAMVLAYSATLDEKYIFTTEGGFGGALGALTTAIWKLQPEQRLAASLGSPIRGKHVPLLLVFTVGLSFFFGTSLFQLVLTVSGALIGWIYLRVYQRMDGIYGDPSKAFALSSLFPYLAQPAVDYMTTKAYSLALMAHVVPAANGDLESRTRATSNQSSTADMERQRRLGLKALAERLEGTEDTVSVDSGLWAL